MKLAAFAVWLLAPLCAFAAEPVVGDPDVARAALERTGRNVPANLADLVAEGERLFFEETFGGNGRTCGTCHPATHNLTLDPAFIATLPADDPLFVAELDPALSELERPVMLRQNSLILEDGVDGFGSSKPLRSVPHTLSMATTIKADRTSPPLDATGWGGDGAGRTPGDLRAFANGAIRQHFTRDLRRLDGVDFRLATDAQLDAMELFLLSLGRTEDPDLSAIRMSDTKAERGRVLFITTDTAGGTKSAAKCNLCHFNGGATSLIAPGVGTNRNFNTGVAVSDKRPAGLPADDGFGTPGDGTFNPPPLIEAADTGPWFHNALRLSTFKDAIAFYDSGAFKKSPAAALLRQLDSGGMLFKGLEFDALDAFLRVLNACFANIDSVVRYQSRAKVASPGGARGMLDVALADLGDAIRVLSERGLHGPAVARLETGRALTQQARASDDAAARSDLLDQAITEERAARAMMVTP